MKVKLNDNTLKFFQSNSSIFNVYSTIILYSIILFIVINSTYVFYRILLDYFDNAHVTILIDALVFTAFSFFISSFLNTMY